VFNSLQRKLGDDVQKHQERTKTWNLEPGPTGTRTRMYGYGYTEILRLYGRLLYGSSYFNKAAGYEISEISEKRLSFRNSVLPTIRFQLPPLLE
jgi:hypothetical protein